ncbi:hypothetical protein [Halomonas sp. MA07-2]|uniref:hypothetical protein n=1 Tax=Halomonas sp. MA07-2 TaxID=3440841 RepID=UPI003F492CC2
MPQAPEIFKRSLDDIKLDGLPPRDDPGFEDAVLVKSERTHFQAAAANSISLGV